MKTGAVCNRVPTGGRQECRLGARPCLRETGCLQETGGFTMLELLVSMGIFAFLGTMMVWFMRESANIFYSGTREAAMSDRQDVVLPRVAADLSGLYVGNDFSPPPPQPTDDQLASGARKPAPPVPTSVRLRAGFVTVRDLPEAAKEHACFYMAFVTAMPDEWSDPLLRRAGAVVSPTAPAYTPSSEAGVQPEGGFKPAGGLMEILWIAIPDDPDHPEFLTLYRGFRTPIGDATDSLLEPDNFDSVAEIVKACEPAARGLLHVGALWRRAFATSWVEDQGTGGETDPYVGRYWDSTRGYESKFPFYRDAASRYDPSDDIFPAFVQLEIVMQQEGVFGFGRGDVLAIDPIGPQDVRMRVADTTPFFEPRLGRDPLYCKIGTEWLSYRRADVDGMSLSVRIQRGQRGTKAAAHVGSSWVHLGAPSRTEVTLPVTRERYAVRGARR